MEMKKEQAKRYVIVSSVAGGATAAARLRRLDKDAKIVLFGETYEEPYDALLLSPEAAAPAKAL